jgi:hypothetical protein
MRNLKLLLIPALLAVAVAGFVLTYSPPQVADGSPAPAIPGEWRGPDVRETVARMLEQGNPMAHESDLDIVED